MAIGDETDDLQIEKRSVKSTEEYDFLGVSIISKKWE